MRSFMRDAAILVSFVSLACAAGASSDVAPSAGEPTAGGSSAPGSSSRGSSAWERQADMKVMAEAARTIGELFGGKRSYSQQDFKAAAETVRSRSGQHLADAFAGEAQQDSKADPVAIASSPEEFGKLARDLEVYAAALSTAADRNPIRLGPETRMSGTLLGSPFASKANASRDAAAVPAEHAYHLMLQTCTNCHAKFRRQ